MPGENQFAYTTVARHFDVERLPSILEKHLPEGTVSLADLGCGDGPFFRLLFQKGTVTAEKPVYAVDEQQDRLNRIMDRFKSVIPICSSVQSVPAIPDGTLDFVVSTMVLEHVKDEETFLWEIHRILKPTGRGYLTTVYKKPWAWYFRKRQGESFLDVSHIREYTDIEHFRKLISLKGCFTILDCELCNLSFPLFDPILFRLFRKSDSPRAAGVIRFFRYLRVPIPGYYTLSVVVQKQASFGCQT